jgi:proliferating cell nuclear antigen
MFEARFATANLLKLLVEAIKLLVGECVFLCTSTGILMQAIDPTKACLVQFLLRSEGFESFRCDRILRLGISIESFAKILKCAKDDDSLTLDCEDVSDTFNMTFEREGRLTTYELKLMNIDTEFMEIPERQYDAVATLSSSEFVHMCHSLSFISGDVTVSCDKEKLKFSVPSDECAGSVVVKANTDTKVLSIDLNKPYEGEFTFEFIKKFEKAAKLAPHITISLIEDGPMIACYESEIGYLKYALAPRIPNDDEKVAATTTKKRKLD